MVYDSEKNKENCKKYYESHKEESNKKAKQYREEHRDELREKAKERWQRNREKYLARKKAYYQENKEHSRQKRREYYQNNKEKCNVYARAYSKKLRQRVRSTLLWYFGYRCNHCGYNKDARALHLDHIHGGGSKEQRKFKNSSQMSKYYHDKPSLVFQRFQCLCANCNFVKRIESGEIKSSF